MFANYKLFDRPTNFGEEAKNEAEIPEGAVAVFFNLTDENGMMLSSEFLEVP